MDQGPLLQHQLPIHDYSLSSDHDYNSQFSGHAHHQSYTTAGTVDQLRRDGSAPLQPPAPFSFTATNNPPTARYVPDRAVAPENSSYQPSNNFTDSSSGSISTSPSSAASSLTYTNYPHGHCTSVASFPPSVQLPQAFVPSYARGPPILDSSGSGMLPPPNPIRSPISSSTNATDREAYANSTSFLARTTLSPGSQAGYGSYPDTPRSVSLTGLSLSNHHHNAYAHPAAHMASPSYNGSQQSECAASFPWPNLEVHSDITCEGQSVTPEIHAKVEKGFFLSTVDQKWTCYRRNYFSVQCSFELHPNINNGRMYLKKSNSSTSEQIQAMGMRLSAAVDGSAGKGIELVQHTPKRDNGPKLKIEVTKVAPSSSARDHTTMSPSGVYGMPTFHATGHVPGPLLPMQADTSSASSVAASQAAAGYSYGGAATAHLPLPGQNTSHTFERVQFKQATANNGKRRASQQYFHLIVELYADIRKDANAEPVWVKVAHRVSEKIVVRGRSPSHYQNEGQNNPGRTGSSGGSSGYNTTAGASYTGGMASGFRAAPTGYGGSLGGGTYRTNASAYGFHPSPEHSGSSASSVDGGAVDSDYPGDAVMSDAERHDIQGQDGYRYYPGPLYEGVPQGGLPLPKIESGARYSTDPSSWVVKNEYSEPIQPTTQWPSSGLSRFQGVDSSRGYFPDLATTYS
ncbi:hypothetical protein PRZ48_009410 [Zasmidium cellare]|uniref:NDT80 domain-containing protein n=1 Tax=Zasmidium cellare TaxID=395010 RepID=A0ABR0ECM2_ZASCE|nr:hypothetical protein PRZ48_009410 [Zasmidium cellare]